MGLTRGFTLFSRRPGEPLAILDHPEWGRRAWVLGEIRQPKKTTHPKVCLHCGERLRAGSKAYRVLQAVGVPALMRARVCSGCVDEMGSVG